MHKDGKQVVETAVEARGGLFRQAGSLGAAHQLRSGSCRTYRYVFGHVKNTRRF
ncbi:MAG: hypothetical protein QOD09_2975 [Bradyrhizobium sp.]|nr:hypothetical protein [Bradyrhizobium sp.]